MSLPIKLICSKSKLRRDGTSLIFIQYCHSSEKRTLLNTGIAIPPGYWSKKRGKISRDLPSEFGDVEKMEVQLTNLLRKAEDMVNYAAKGKHGCPVDFLRANFKLKEPCYLITDNGAKKNIDVFDNIDQYIQSKQTSVKHCTINVISAMKKHLKSFESFRNQPVTFDSFDALFYEEFVRYLTYDIIQMRRREEIRGLKMNTIGKTIKHLKSFLKDRMRKKIIPFFDMTSFKVMEEEVDAVYLSWNEISLIYHLDLSENPHLEKYRDIFVLGCLTGFRFSDYSDIKPDEIRDGMLYVTQNKTLTQVVVPLRPDSKRILIDKYNMQMPQISNPNLNFYIKEVVKMAGIDEQIKITHKRGNKIIEEVRPKYAWITSHTCRRSFCTNEFLEGTPIQLIMAISGHKTEKAFRRYIKAEQVQKAYMIKKLWEKRPDL
ncbi:MAG: phage integrase SAM-like domain-containing protein [Sediminibacterium sp.]|nr:phage integrase SAM-like domain-containing protein [Sediminibacterium sp.]